MKRKKEFNFKEFILSALSKVSRTQWYYGVTFVLFSFFNFYLAQNNLAVHNKATGTVLQYVNFLGILFGISFLLLIPILSQFNFKKWFPLKLIVSYLVYNTLSYLTEITIYLNNPCLLYRSDAADDGESVDLGGRRIIKKIFFQAEDGIRDLVRSRGLGDVYKRQLLN